MTESTQEGMLEADREPFTCPKDHDMTLQVCAAARAGKGPVIKLSRADRAPEQGRRIRARCNECDPPRLVIFLVADSDCPSEVPEETEDA